MGDTRLQTMVTLTVKRHHFTFLLISEGLSAKVESVPRILVHKRRGICFAQHVLSFHKVTAGKCI